MALADNLISFWSLDEASGNALDAHGSNDLTDNNTVDSATGIIGNARSFTKANSEYFSHADNADLSTGDIDFTFAGWANVSSYTGFPGILGKDNGGSGEREYGLYTYSGRFRWYVSDNGTSESTAVEFTGLTTATWYFFVVYHDSVNNIISISVNDGTPVTAAHSTGINDGTADFRIGDVPYNNLYMAGQIDELGFWKRVLTSSEITELYNSGSGRDYSYISGGGGGNRRRRSIICGAG